MNIKNTKVMTNTHKKIMIENLIKRNFEVLFSKDDFVVNFTPLEIDDIFVSFEVVIFKHASIKFEIKFDFSVNAINLFTGFQDGIEYQQLEDITRTINAIVKTLNILHNNEYNGKPPIFFNNEYVITTDFTDIGFIKKTGERILLVHRNKYYSVIEFDESGAPITRTLDSEMDVYRWISAKGRTHTIDIYNNDGVVFYVNYLYYQDDEDEVTDNEI